MNPTRHIINHSRSVVWKDSDGKELWVEMSDCRVMISHKAREVFLFNLNKREAFVTVYENGNWKNGHKGFEYLQITMEGVYEAFVKEFEPELYEVY